MLKRGYIRIYHHFSRKHLRRYSSEFEGRPNQRPQDTLRQRVLMATGLAGQRLRYARPDCLTGKGGSRPATGRAVYPAERKGAERAMAKGSRGQAGKGRRSKLAMPARIPDTPENVARTLLNAPPKKPAEWEYLRKPGRTDG